MYPDKLREIILKAIRYRKTLKFKKGAIYRCPNRFIFRRLKVNQAYAALLLHKRIQDGPIFHLWYGYIRTVVVWDSAGMR